MKPKTLTCSFFLAAASRAFVACALKLVVDALLWIELVLAFLRRVFCVDWLGADSDSCKVAARVEFDGWY